MVDKEGMHGTLSRQSSSSSVLLADDIISRGPFSSPVFTKRSTLSFVVGGAAAGCGNVGSDDSAVEDSWRTMQVRESIGSFTVSSSSSRFAFSVGPTPPRNKTSLSKSPESTRTFRLFNRGVTFNGNIGEMSVASTVRL